MKRSRRNLFRITVIALAFLALSVSFYGSKNRVEAVVLPGVAPAAPTCYPSCSPTDARFFSLAGSSLFTFAGGATTIGLEVDGSANPATFTVGIFDGDNAGLWDQDTLNTGVPVVFELFGDSNNDGTADTGVLETLPNGSMVDNGWAYFTVSHNAAARLGGVGTNYVYQLRASLAVAIGMVQNNFKVAADSAQTQLFITPQVLSFQAFQNNAAEFLIIHPSGMTHDVVPSNYDGIWNFSFLVEPAQTAVNVWEGDLDIGSVLTPILDLDDPTTPNVLPDDGTLPASLSFSLGGATGINPEGVGTIALCAGNPNIGGCPPDDSALAQFRRASGIPLLGIVTSLIPPVGPPIVNLNPSGTNEWELFRVAGTADPLPAFTDSTVGTPNPATGLWTYRISGMDLGNLFALRFNSRLVIDPFKVGDTVFCDTNQNGVQDPGDLGKPGVTVELLNNLNVVVATDVTDAQGKYSFSVSPGTFTVRVAASNFGAGQPLDGLTETTNYGVPNQRTQIVVNSDLLDYDFGYNCVSTVVSQGCSPGFWKNHPNAYPQGITENTLFVTVFGENAFPGKTLNQVLSQGGGGLNALGRIIVSAYLNASTVNGFPATPAQVIQDFKDVFPGGDYEALKDQYEDLQDPCPF